MSPFALLAIAVGALLLWYAFSGNTPLALIKSLLPSTAKKK